MKKSKIIIYATGGTILSRRDNESGVVKPAYTGKELMDSMSSWFEDFKIEVVEFSNLPGSDLTLRNGMELAKSLRNKVEDKTVDGVVVLQGTDTMDEIPYFVNLVVEAKVPIVFTGAMKSGNDLYADTLGNLLGACVVAASKESVGQGVLVFFNEEIFSAADVYKKHTSRIDAFSSIYGTLGAVLNKQVYYHRLMPKSQTYEIEKIESNVPLIVMHTGFNEEYLQLVLELKSVKGLVIQGYGSGNIPAPIMPLIKKIIDRGVVVVIASRCSTGETSASYGYSGGGADLTDAKAIMSGYLSGIQSRIYLEVLLEAGYTLEEIIEKFK